MKKLTILSLVFAISLIAAGSFLTVETSGQKSKFKRSTQPIPNQYIVVLEENFVGRSAHASEVEAEFQFLSSLYGGELRAVYSSAMKGYAATMSAAQAEALSRNERVRFVEEDSVISVSETQVNAPWNLDRVDQRGLPLDTTYGYTQSGAGAHIYILDTGIRVTHQEFGGRASVVFDALTDGQNGLDCNGHGTHVAGTAAGSTYGVAKNALVHSVRVLPCSGNGQISDLILGIDWVTANRVNPAVANISISAPGGSPSLEDAVTNSVASGVTYTIAAGNNARTACDVTPARTASAITVGASYQIDARAQFSNYGPCVDLFAPGYEIVSAGIASDSATRMLNGTSMAAPLVAGVAAVYRAANPSANSVGVTQAIISNATSGVITNIDSTSPNKLLYSWLGTAPAPTPTPTPTVTPTPSPTATPAPAPTGRINVRKRANSTGTSSTTAFPYQATNIPTANFTLISNQEFSDPSVPGDAPTISVTEAPVVGWQLIAVECVETGGATVPNTTVDLANQRANINVESGETVTCTFTSEELVPTAGEVSISGRIVDTRGHGVRGVTLSLLNARTGETLYAVTNNFGFYSFNELEVSTFYVLTAFGTKRFTIANNQRSFTLTDELSNLDFLAESSNW